MVRHKLLYAVSLGFALGVFVYSLFRTVWPFGQTFSFFIIFVATVLGVYLLSRRYLNSYLSLGVAFLLCFGLGIMRYGAVIADDYHATLHSLVGEEVVVEGIIVDEPDRREASTRLIVGFDTLLSPAEEKIERAKILVTTDPYWEYQYGDRVRVSGKLTLPENFESDTGRTFDYVSYLGKDDIFYQISFADIIYVSSGHGNTIKKVLFGIKHTLVGNIERALPSPESGLLSGEIFGERGGIPDTLEEAFRKTGVIHVVVLSGYNVTIVADAIIRLFAFLPRALGFTFAGLGIVMFAVLTGAGATIVRASVMAILVIVSRAFGREYYVIRALILAGLIMIVHNPKILLFDISFQLSFLATLGLILVSPFVERKIGFVTDTLQMRSNAVATISAQVLVLPLLLYYTGEVSLLTIPSNMLVLFVIPLTMLLGFVTSLLAFFPFSLGIIAAPVYALLHYQIMIVEFFSSLPYSSFTIPEFSPGVLIEFYVIIIIFVLYLRRRSKK